jgi:hypothetical protein
MPVGTPVFPTTLDDISSLGGVADDFSTALSAGIDADDTTIPVASTTGATSAGWKVIDNEIFTHTGKTSNTFTGCVRGVSGTTAASHSSGADVEDLAIAAHRETLRAAIEAIEAKLGTGSAIAVNKLVAQTASRALVSDGSGFISPSAVTAAELADLPGAVAALISAMSSKLNASAISGFGLTLVDDADAAAARATLGLAALAVLAEIGNGHVASNAAIALSKLAAVTASRALVSDGAGLITPSSVTAAELGYLAGVNSGIQAQIDGLAAGIYNVLDYGLIGDGATDDTEALQDLIDLVAAAGGGTIFFPTEGPYIINGALQDGSRRNAQILLPETAIDDPQFSITFKGYVKPACSPSGLYEIDLPAGTKIKSTLAAGSGTAPAVIGGHGPEGGLYNEVSYCHIEFVDLILQTIANPSYSCLDLKHYTSVGLQDVIIIAGDKMSTPDIVEPTTATSYGLRFPQDSSGILQQIRCQVNIFGFYTGMLMGELANIEALGIWMCQIAIECPLGHHPVLIQRFLQFWCAMGIKWTAEMWIDIVQYDIEHSGAAWYTTTYDIQDPSNLGQGEVKWLSLYAPTATRDDLLVNGAANLIYRELGVPAVNPVVAPVLESAEIGDVSDIVIALSFSEVVKSPDFELGLSVEVNAVPATIVGVTRQADKTKVRIEIDTSVVPGDVVTLSYSADDGFIQSDGGAQLADLVDESVLNNTDSGTSVLLDHFTDSNGTALPSHTMDTGPGWTRIEGSGGNQSTIESNKLQNFLDPLSAYSYVADAGEADAMCVASFTPGAVSDSNYCQILFRVTDINNYWSLRVHGNTVDLVKYVSGVETVVDTDTGSFSAGVPSTYTVLANGSAISVSAGGVDLSTSDAFNNTATKWGIRTYCSGVVSTCDNFQVTIE